MQIIKNPNKASWSELIKRPTQSVDSIEETVVQIFDDVKRNGNLAIQKYTALFDGIDTEVKEVSKDEMVSASRNVPEELKAAIQIAKKNIETFHKAQKTNKIEVETMPGVHCWQEKRPIEKIGLYHSRTPLKMTKDNFLVSDDMELLYYYYNRISMYQFKNIFSEKDGKMLQNILEEEE